MRRAATILLAILTLAAAPSLTPPTGETLPDGLTFSNVTGGETAAKDFLGHGPVALAPVYFTCPTVCGLTETRVTQAFAEAGLKPGDDAELVFLSFDPRDTADTAGEARDRIRRAAPEGFDSTSARVLYGGDAAAAMDAIGYQRRFDPESAEFAHPAALAVLTPEGRVSAWLSPAGLAPDQLRRALTDASGGTIGGVVQQALLLCWRFDPETGKYTPRIMAMLQIGGVLTVLILGGIILLAGRGGR